MLAFPLTTKERGNHFLHIFLKPPIFLQKLVKVGSHFILLDHPSISGTENKSLNFSLRGSPASSYVIPLRFKNSLSTLFVSTPKLPSL
jgi:hypothetical protein